MKKIIVIIITITFLAGCVTNPKPKKVDVDMKNPDGDSIGTISLEEQADGVMLKIDLEGLPPGNHAIHFHDKGSCKIPDFLSAGEHFNPDDKKHGLLNPEGPHAGDLPNLVVKEDGTVKVDIVAPQVTLTKEKTSLLTKEGTSLVIHENPDDGMSQPAGESGARIACGEISGEKKPGQESAQDDTGSEE
ncbi:superoxide dismutase [Cu-Zn] [Bacillus carboniphilus]|uniref:Superoxide dismutase [Cu-Zn] n=1 Tax=Bacillus carboniphilus TaxID=86663 RepID=A0ABP3FWG3_9BACI